MFIYYPLDEIKEALNCGNDKAVKLLAELDSGKGIGLIQRVKQGQGKPARIYVKRFTTREIEPQVENQPSPPPRNPDFGKSECNYTYMNQTERSYTNPSIRPEIEKMDWQACREEVMENICFDQLAEEYGREDVEGVTDLIADVLTSTQPTIQIGREKVSIQAVVSRFRKLDETHVQYVFDCLRRNTTKVCNIRAYLLTSLYNAPTTIGQFYQAEVQHDLYGSG